MSIDTLVNDIYDSVKNGVVDSSKLQETSVKFGKAMEGIFKSSLTKREQQPRRLRASNFGRPCKRAIWYDINGEHETEELQPNTLIKFMFGHILEELLLALTEVSGHEVTDQQAEHDIHGVKGHQDARIDGELVDVKSASSYAYKKFKNNELDHTNDSFGYLPQISFYRQGDERVHFLVIDKQNGSICLHTPKPSNLLGNVDAYVKSVKAVTEASSPPEKGFTDIADGKSGNKKLCVECSYCQHKLECWEGLRLFNYSGKPRFLTVVEKEPKVEELQIG